MNKNKNAFTLTEMLIVIGLMLILVAIFLPAIGHFRELARRSSCASNQRQILLALQAYTADEDYYPATTVDLTDRECLASDWGISQATMSTWPLLSQSLNRYTQNISIFLCPDTQSIDKDDNGDACSVTQAAFFAAGMSYLQRTSLSLGPTLLPIRWDAIANPATTDITHCPPFFHGSLANDSFTVVGFADGHCKAITRGELIALSQIAP